MRTPLPYLKFLLTATNEHGVHSPFIFSYVTKCLYTKPEYFRQKSRNILFKSVAYFGAERVRLPDSDEALKKQIEKQMWQQFPSIQFENGPFDILFAHPSEAEKLVNAQSTVAGKLKNPTSLEKNIHNDSLLLVDGIHENRAHLSLWEKLKNHPKTTVTVDLFYCGAIFFRQEQAEEHFRIRI